MTDYVACDISEFQPPVNDTYPHRWLSFRACDGDYIDKNAAQNLAWSVNARRVGKIDGFTVYVVYRPGKSASILQALDGLGVPNDCMAMIDAETWGGQISGDHSAELNQLATSLATRQKSQQRVWGYGNRGDLATLWPGRPSWLGVVVASYGGSNPNIPGQVGWQYTDGTWNVPNLPSSSAPFGPCDHNLFTVSTAPTPAPNTEDDMSVAFQTYPSDVTLKVKGAVYMVVSVQGVGDHQQWMKDRATLADRQARVKAAGGDTTVRASQHSRDYFGPVIGHDPEAG